TAAWAAAAFVLYWFLSRRRVPPSLKFVATFWDLSLLTLLLALTQGGPKSSLLVLYFLIIAAAPLRLSLPLVYVATLGSIAAYLVLLGHYIFVVIGVQDYYGDRLRFGVPRTPEVIFILCLGAAGLPAGQSVRQARRLA